MKYSVFTVGMPEFTPEEGLKQLAANGYEGVEWRVTKIYPELSGEKPSYWRNNLCTIDETKAVEQAAQIKAMCAEHGIEISALCTYLRNSSDLAQIEEAMRAAVLMGATQIRVSPDGYDGTQNYRTMFDKAVADYTKIEELAKKHGVKVLIEMHMNTLTPSASSAYRLVSHFDPAYIGVIYDTGNVIYEGAEQYKMALEILGEYLAHVHVKNAAWKLDSEENGVKVFKPDWATFKGGYANFPLFFEALKSTGYDGWVTFEDFSDVPTQEKLRDNLAYIKSIVG